MSTHWRTWCWIVGLGVAGCASGDEVLLGKEALQGWDGAVPMPPPSPAPSQNRSDTPLQPPTLPVPKSLKEPPLRQLCGESVTEVAVDLDIPIEAPVCDIGSCSIPALERLVPLSDGTVWALFDNSDWDSPLTRLTHYDSDGATLGSIDIAAFDATIAVDDRGTLWVSAQQKDDRTLQRFDDRARPIGDPITLDTRPPSPIPFPSSARAIAAVPDRGVVVASPGTPASITLFDHDGMRVWTKEAQNSTDEVVLASGKSRFALFGATPREPAYVGITLEMYSVSGDLVWTSESTVNQSTPEIPYYFWPSMDSLDHVTLVVTPPMPPGETEERADRVDLERFDADGVSRWAFRLEHEFAWAGEAVGPNGELYVVAINQSAIDRIAPDGERCRRFIPDGVDGVEQLAIAPNGRLWLESIHDGGRLSIARLEVITP